MAGVVAVESTMGFGEGSGEGTGLSTFPVLEAGGGWLVGFRVGEADGVLLCPSDAPKGLWLGDGDICCGERESLGRGRSSRVARTAAVSMTKRGWVLNRNESSA